MRNDEPVMPDTADELAATGTGRLLLDAPSGG
jgi:hypothetical protein